MEMISLREALQRKFLRQKQIKSLRYHACGSCVHIGKISPGCIFCFKGEPSRQNYLCGNKCNLNCIYCTSAKNQPELTKKNIQERKKELLSLIRSPDYVPSALSFSGGGEPLLYFNIISDFVKFIHKAHKNLKNKPWLYLYTNGILADDTMLLKLKALGFNEIRFHLGASNFSKKVYSHIEMAVRYFKVVTVETPAWPPHRKELFRMLPIINNLGVKHLNLGEIELNQYNLARMLNSFPDLELYPCYEIHVDDGGLVYEIMKEVIRKKYSFSVLDCNCLVKLIQRGNAKGLCSQDLNGLIVKRV